MHTRHRSILAAILVLLGLTASVILVTSGAATAAPRAGSETCVQPHSKDDSVHIVGCLTDNRKKPAAAVPDVEVSVEDESGKSIGNGTSDATGIFDVKIPGSSVEALGKTYTIKIDSETLPKGTSLVDKKKTALKVKITTDADVFVTFPIGKKAAAGEARPPRPFSSWSAGSRSRCCSRWRRWACR